MHRIGFILTSDVIHKVCSRSITFVPCPYDLSGDGETSKASVEMSDFDDNLKICMNRWVIPPGVKAAFKTFVVTAIFRYGRKFLQGSYFADEMSKINKDDNGLSNLLDMSYNEYRDLCGSFLILMKNDTQNMQLWMSATNLTLMKQQRSMKSSKSSLHDSTSRLFRRSSEVQRREFYQDSDSISSGKYGSQSVLGGLSYSSPSINVQSMRYPNFNKVKRTKSDEEEGNKSVLQMMNMRRRCLSD